MCWCCKLEVQVCDCTGENNVASNRRFGTTVKMIKLKLKRCDLSMIGKKSELQVRLSWQIMDERKMIFEDLCFTPPPRKILRKCFCIKVERCKKFIEKKKKIVASVHNVGHVIEA